MSNAPGVLNDDAWLALCDQGDGDIFSIYPKILEQLYLQEEDARSEGLQNEAENIVLPSDKEWKLKQYFQLVGLQRSCNVVPGEDESFDVASSLEDEAGGWRGLRSAHPNAPPPVPLPAAPGPEWDICEVIKAVHLLNKPPTPAEFEDEQEMRRVYALIYDVFRYKTILNQTIDDVAFFSVYPEEIPRRHLTWLFIMELARRRWAARARPQQALAAALLAAAGPAVVTLERRVWAHRVHFAASVARIRIKNRAFSLSELLPTHLRDDRLSSCLNRDLITGWVNMYKSKNVSDLIHKLNNLGYTYSSSRNLAMMQYRFDRVCSRFITLRPPPNDTITQCHLIKDGTIILQEREFCEGAAMFCRALRRAALRGDVAQTHATSPRTTAYLAAALRDLGGAEASVARPARCPLAAECAHVDVLYVYGAGEKLDQYRDTLRALGVRAEGGAAERSAGGPGGVFVRVVAEAVHARAHLPAGVVAALATPPNSYSAVTDPVDLVCGRGGDIAMIEVLTETELDISGKTRVARILEEQKKTLKFLMSKPQIQLVMYETHSALPAENGDMVTRAVAESNRLARERHALLRRDVTRVACAAVTSTTLDTDMSALDSESTCASPAPPPPVERTPRDPDMDSADIVVPRCDLFELKRLPNLSNGLDINFTLEKDGCYLGLIQRKEITRLDAKYMIKMAEDRGLFSGAASPGPRRDRRAEAAQRERQQGAARRKQRSGKIEMDRIAAPTCASIWHTVQSDGAQQACCERHARRHAAAAPCPCGHRSRPGSHAARPASAAPPQAHPCRPLFPVSVHDVQLDEARARVRRRPQTTYLLA